jgi:oxaloacetate decarboxylase alpha subunit
MVAAGPARRSYDPTHKPVKTLIAKLAARKDLYSVKIEKSGFNLEMTGPSA